MWISVWRPLVIAFGVAGGLIAAATGISVSETARGVLASIVVAMMVFQGVVSLGAIVAGVWGPATRLVRPSPLEELKPRKTDLSAMRTQRQLW